MNPLRSVGARLGLALLLVLVGALASVYLVVVPSLERRLVDSRVSQLARVAPPVADELVRSQLNLQAVAEQEARNVLNARIVVFWVDYVPRVHLRSQADTGSDARDVADDPVALRAAATLKDQRGTATTRSGRFAEVAYPVRIDNSPAVILFSVSLADALATVQTVKRRLLGAGLLALLVSLVVGYGAASVFGRRIRRLERAADRIAGGKFDEPVHDRGSDEVGDLARAFERMRRRLAHLDRARREFIANASHELRTPLFSLAGFLELLADEDLDERTRSEFLSEMRGQVERLTRLATDLLDLSRLDAGRMRVERETLDLSELAREIVAQFRVLAGAGGRSLELADGGAVAALGDEQRVLQVARILVENALIHTPRGTRITVGACSLDGRAALVVEDNGPGIPRDEAEHVFDRFYRVDGAVASGSGLGLAIARELAHMMDGEMELEAISGRTAFRVVLPPAGVRQRARFHVKPTA